MWLSIDPCSFVGGTIFVLSFLLDKLFLFPLSDNLCTILKQLGRISYRSTADPDSSGDGTICSHILAVAVRDRVEPGANILAAIGVLGTSTDDVTLRPLALELASIGCRLGPLAMHHAVSPFALVNVTISKLINSAPLWQIV